MADYDPKMIDAIGFAMAEFMGTPWNGMPDEEKAAARPLIATALSALPLTPEALNAIWRGEAVVALPGSLSQDVMRESWMHRKGDTVKREMWVNEADYLRAYFADTKKE